MVTELEKDVMDGRVDGILIGVATRLSGVYGLLRQEAKSSFSQNGYNLSVLIFVVKRSVTVFFSLSRVSD